MQVGRKVQRMPKHNNIVSLAEDNRKKHFERLTPKQQAFVSEYIRNGGNGLQACKYAGYSGSDKVLGVQASKLLKNGSILLALEKEKEIMMNRGGNRVLSADEVLAGLTTIAVDMECKPSERLKALELLGKYHALFTDKLDVTSTDYASIIEESRSRLHSVC